MVFFIDDRKYDFSEEELNGRLISDEGKEGNVYKIGDTAVKIYRKRKYKDRLDENTAELLKKINTSRVLMPKESVFDDEHNFSGYTTPFIQTKMNKQNIHKLMKMKKLYEEIKLFEEDVRKLSSENISIADLTIDNVEVSNGIYSVDPGSFFVLEEDNRFLGSLNREEVKLFFLNSIMSNGLTKKDTNKLKDHFLYSTTLSEVIEYENIDPDETVYKFVKKIVNKR